MRKIRLVAVPAVGLAMMFATTAQPALAVSPGPINDPAQYVPALSLLVQDACTGLALPGLSISLTSAAGQPDPGPSQIPAPGLYLWSHSALAVGSHTLSLSAPGFTPIGDPASGTSPITVLKNPGPNGLVAYSEFVQGVTASVMLAPLSPDSSCRGLSAIPLPQLAGRVVNGKTFKDPGQ